MSFRPNITINYPNCLVYIMFVIFSVSPGLAEEKGAAYYDFGIFAYEDGDLEDAEKNFKHALQMNPENPNYYHYLGKIYLKKEQYEEATRYLTMAWQYNPDLMGLTYDKAMVAFKTNEYTSASSLFTRVLEKDASNYLARYYMGICMFKQKQYDQAIEHLYQAGEKSSGIKANALYYVGICQLKTNNISKAVETFSWVKENTNSAHLKKNAEKWIQTTRQLKKAASRVHLYFKLSGQYDDNMPLEPVDEDIYFDQDDAAAVAYFSGTCRLVKLKHFSGGIGYNYFQTYQADLPEYNLTASTPNIYINFQQNPIILGLSYLPSYYWLYTDRYMTRNQVKSTLSWKMIKNISSHLILNYYDDNHFLNADRTGHIYETQVTTYFRFRNKNLIYSGMDYMTTSPFHPNFEYNQLTVRLGAKCNLFWDINLTLMGKFNDRNYKNEDSNHGIKREDTKSYGLVSLSRKLFYDEVTISLEYSHTINDSNISVNEYRKNTISLSLIAQSNYID